MEFAESIFTKVLLCPANYLGKTHSALIIDRSQDVHHERTPNDLGTAAFAEGLYVGANYHLHDSNPETWVHDIPLMQQAGFRVVRLGHLAWDSYEP